MGFTLVPITRTYLDGASAPMTGTVRLQLTSPITNSGQVYNDLGQTLTLNGAGAISATAYATDDVGTSPSAALQVTETLNGLAPVVYYIAVPALGGPIDLATAPQLASAPLPAVVYQTANQRGLPGGYPPLDVNGKVPSTMLPPASGGGVVVGTTVGTVAAGDDSRIVGAAQKASNLNDLTDKALSRTNLGLGAAATMGLGTTNGTVAAGNDTRLVNALQKTANLSDLVNPAQARGSLGLGGAAVLNVGTASNQVAAGDYATPRARITVDDLMANTPFYIAHRGSGAEFPEHTMEAYSASVSAGAQAIEVSCHATPDGVLFCMHDTTLDRATGSAFTGSNLVYPWSVMKEKVKINQQALLGPGVSTRDVPTVREVLERFLGRVVIFIEAKSNAAVPILQNLLLSIPGAQKSVVWKNYYTANSFAWAHNNGFRTWAYVDATTTSAQMDAVDGVNIDYWGIPDASTDAQISMIVARGKKTIVWEVHRRSQRDHLVSLGVKGMMCSEYLYVTHATTSPILTDAPVSWQIKSPGDIGASPSDPNFALKWNTTSGGVYCPATSGNGVCLGSRSCMVDGATGYKITFDMMFPVLPTGTLHAGLWFGAADDSKHQFGVGPATGAYRMLVRPVAGDVQLYTVAAGAASGVQVTPTMTTAAMVAGAWMSFEIEVNATQVILRRTDSTGWSATFTNSAYRGRYFGIQNGSLTDVTTLPLFRNIKTVAV